MKCNKTKGWQLEIKSLDDISFKELVDGRIEFYIKDKSGARIYKLYNEMSPSNWRDFKEFARKQLTKNHE